MIYLLHANSCYLCYVMPMKPKTTKGRPVIGTEPKTIISITLDTGKLRKLDAKVGPGQRSAVIEQAIDYMFKRKDWVSE